MNSDISERVEADVLIIGAGAAGLFTALHLPERLRVVIVDKGTATRGSSFWAQGGIAAALGADDSVELHERDTVTVAAGHADWSAVAVLCSEAPGCVLELAELGCNFDREDNGALHLAREGGQSVARSVHSADATGAAVMQTLRARVSPRVLRLPGSCVRLALAEGRCVGGWVLNETRLVEIRAAAIVIAAGGVGGLFEATTNPPGATGDGIALAYEAGAGIADAEFVQFHPTALRVDERQRPLLTEALRGAGAFIVDERGERFLFDIHPDGELAPRDVVARAIAARPAFLDCRHLGAATIESHFFSVANACRKRGLDPVTDLLPVAPAAHYFVGGIQTDLDGRSSIPRLYAVGECASTGAHGANRLAGNSLAEALVFGRRAARAIAGQRHAPLKAFPEPPRLDPAERAVEQLWQRVRATCSGALGLERDAAGLSSARHSLESIASLPPSLHPEVAELRSAAITASLIARGAALRNESRGVHFRTDHPHTEPTWAGVRLRLGPETRPEIVF